MSAAFCVLTCRLFQSGHCLRHLTPKERDQVISMHGATIVAESHLGCRYRVAPAPNLPTESCICVSPAHADIARHAPGIPGCPMVLFTVRPHPLVMPIPDAADGPCTFIMHSPSANAPTPRRVPNCQTSGSPQATSRSSEFVEAPDFPCLRVHRSRTGSMHRHSSLRFGGIFNAPASWESNRRTVSTDCPESRCPHFFAYRPRVA
jgi:hypothetical protein